MPGRLLSLQCQGPWATGTAKEKLTPPRHVLPAARGGVQVRLQPAGQKPRKVTGPAEEEEKDRLGEKGYDSPHKDTAKTDGNTAAVPGMAQPPPGDGRYPLLPSLCPDTAGCVGIRRPAPAPLPVP